jgi:hypothetical protein
VRIVLVRLKADTTYSNMYLAAAVVVAHLAFAAFACAGGLLVLRWPRLAWIHLPSACWAAYVELSETICPLTLLENALRTRAGLDVYSGDFIARYVFPVLYPEGLTREIQVALGAAVMVLNAGVYGWLLWRRRTRVAAPGGTARLI